MRGIKQRIKKLTHATIAPYGFIIDKRCVRDNGRGNRFGILLRERSKGWRIGYLIVREHAIRQLENHPDSLETFEPVKGRAAIAFAWHDKPDDIEIFLLDKPVVVKKGIWHEVASLDGPCEIKIFENDKITTYHHTLGRAVHVRTKTGQTQSE